MSTILAFLIIGTILALHGLLQLISSAVINTNVLGILPMDGSIPYPTVTICPIQFYDKWNLQKAFLNDIDLFDNGNYHSDIPSQFKVIIEQIEVQSTH